VIGNILLIIETMRRIRPFRYWYYFRQGYSLYFAFIFAAINMLVVTYFLAIERAPFLKEIFPSFVSYAFTLLVIGIPVLVLVGFTHFKRIAAYKSEVEVTVESNPWIYKIHPGHTKHVSMPYQLMMSKLMVKLLLGEKITPEEIKKMEGIQEKMQKLINGGYVGLEGKKLPFKEDSKE